MSTTITIARQPHELVQQRDARGRTSTLHAAVPTGPDQWRTACGSPLSRREGVTITAWQGEAAHAELARPGARHCRRCTAVGDGIE